MKLPHWIPECPRSFFFEDEWLAMSHEERQWSFVTDVAICLVVLGLIWAVS